MGNSISKITAFTFRASGMGQDLRTVKDQHGLPVLKRTHAGDQIPGCSVPEQEN